jgi:release factor glutamine methyltransferase
MAEKLQTITELRHHISALLKQLWSAAEAEAMATAIINEYTGMSAARQLAFGDHRPQMNEVSAMISAATRAAAGEPLQYIFGYTVFCGHRINVGPGVLIPRPETEEMTTLVIRDNRGFSGTVTDIGTGSGCIAIALALAFPHATVWAADSSDKALHLASMNISATGAPVNLLKADILRHNVETIPVSNIIISNPPYVTESEKETMKVNVLDHEPPDALFVPDSDPLIYYRHIVSTADTRLAPYGCVWLEVNASFAGETARLFSDARYREVRIIEDMLGKQRFIRAEKYGYQ